MIIREAYRDVRHRVCHDHYTGHLPLPEDAPTLGPVEDSRDTGCEWCEAIVDETGPILDATIHQVLAMSGSDVEGRPLHESIVRLVLARLRSKRIHVSREVVLERLHQILGGES